MDNNIYITLNDGKYEYTFNAKEGTQVIKRNGQPWRDETGDNLLLEMAQRIDQLEDEVAELEEDLAAERAGDDW